MKETNFRALRREEKRKAYERKRARLQAVRAKALEEKQKKERERKQDSDEPGSFIPDTFVGRFEFVRRGGIVYTDSKLLKDTSSQISFMRVSFEDCSESTAKEICRIRANAAIVRSRTQSI